MIIGQSVIQNSVVMALVSVVISLYVIGLQRIRGQTSSSALKRPQHIPMDNPQSENADV